MTTKEKLLALFEEHKGIYFSGEELADKLALAYTYLEEVQEYCYKM